MPPPPADVHQPSWLGREEQGQLSGALCVSDFLHQFGKALGVRALSFADLERVLAGGWAWVVCERVCVRVHTHVCMGVWLGMRGGGLRLLPACPFASLAGEPQRCTAVLSSQLPAAHAGPLCRRGEGRQGRAWQ